MDKRELLEILGDWNFWRKDLETGRERTKYLDECLRRLDANVVLAVIGARRAGKSFILRQLVKKLVEKGVAKEDSLMVNFDDKRFAEFYPKLLDEVWDAYQEFVKPVKPAAGGKPFVFLDEVQNVPGWEKWVRTMHELGKAKIIVSGSSSKLLAGELATLLTGRHLDVVVFPFDFKEFLSFKNLEAAGELDFATKKTELKRAFNEYLEFGGFPEVVLTADAGDKKQLLLTYFDDVLTKDVEKRHKVRESGKLRALARFYLTNASNSVTFNSLKKFLGTTTNTIEKFSSYLEEANLVFFVKRFSFKVREQEKTARKVYSIDAGLANAVGFKFSPNYGKTAENVVAVALRKKQAQNPGVEAYYWKNARGEEVDFVVKEGLKVKQLIQACWNLGGYETRNREVKALLKASRELKCRNLVVVTEDYEAQEKTGGEKINFIPLWKWLLQP